MPPKRKRRASKRWVRRVQTTSNAMDIPAGTFVGSPHKIALGLRRAALSSRRTKGTKFRSAMSMLNWYINRGGRGISIPRRRALEEAKTELRRVFGRSLRAASPSRPRRAPRR